LASIRGTCRAVLNRWRLQFEPATICGLSRHFFARKKALFYRPNLFDTSFLPENIAPEALDLTADVHLLLQQEGKTTCVPIALLCFALALKERRKKPWNACLRLYDQMIGKEEGKGKEEPQGKKKIGQLFCQNDEVIFAFFFLVLQKQKKLAFWATFFGRNFHFFSVTVRK